MLLCTIRSVGNAAFFSRTSLLAVKRSIRAVPCSTLSSREVRLPTSVSTKVRFWMKLRFANSDPSIFTLRRYRLSKT